MLLFLRGDRAFSGMELPEGISFTRYVPFYPPMLLFAEKTPGMRDFSFRICMYSAPGSALSRPGLCHAQPRDFPMVAEQSFHDHEADGQHGECQGYQQKGNDGFQYDALVLSKGDRQHLSGACQCRDQYGSEISEGSVKGKAK
jgi:hypothetical protein